jgi:hypothetical protein
VEVQLHALLTSQQTEMGDHLQAPAVQFPGGKNCKSRPFSPRPKRYYRNGYPTRPKKGGGGFISQNKIYCISIATCRSQWPRGLRRGSATARLLRLWVRIPPEVWKSVESCVLSGRGLSDGLITRPEQSYRLWCVVVCDLETS